MPRNIEIKARLNDLSATQKLAAAIATEGPIEINQDDTFFNCPNGRLKLRQFSTNLGELIFYQRPDQSGPKESFYLISKTSNPDSLRDALTHGYGQIGRIKKHRTLFMSGRTRIHLDRVEGLGDFMELEVVLGEQESSETGRIEARQLLEKLEILPDQLIEVAYLDLLMAKSA